MSISGHYYYMASFIASRGKTWNPITELHSSELTVRKELQAMGLFIAKDIAGKNRFYKTASFDADVNFVFLTQDMEHLSMYSGGELPILTALFLTMSISFPICGWNYSCSAT